MDNDTQNTLPKTSQDESEIDSLPFQEDQNRQNKVPDSTQENSIKREKQEQLEDNCECQNEDKKNPQSIQTNDQLSQEPDKPLQINFSSNCSETTAESSNSQGTIETFPQHQCEKRPLKNDDALTQKPQIEHLSQFFSSKDSWKPIESLTSRKEKSETLINEWGTSIQNFFNGTSEISQIPPSNQNEQNNEQVRDKEISKNWETLETEKQFEDSEIANETSDKEKDGLVNTQEIQKIESQNNDILDRQGQDEISRNFFVFHID